MSGYSFFVPGIPATQGSMRHIGSGRMLHSDDLQPWREAIGYCARAAGVQLAEGAVTLTLLFYLPRGKSVKRELPSVKPDLDKLCRAVGDALEGIAYVGDGAICRLLASKVYSDSPGVQISIEEIS